MERGTSRRWARKTEIDFYAVWGTHPCHMRVGIWLVYARFSLGMIYEWTNSLPTGSKITRVLCRVQYRAECSKV